MSMRATAVIPTSSNNPWKALQSSNSTKTGVHSQQQQQQHQQQHQQQQQNNQFTHGSGIEGDGSNEAQQDVRDDTTTADQPANSNFTQSPTSVPPQLTLSDSYRLFLSQMSNGQPAYLGPDSLMSDVWGAIQYPRFLCGSPSSVACLSEGHETTDVYNCDGATPMNSLLPYVPLMRIVAEELSVLRIRSGMGHSHLNRILQGDVPLGAKEVWFDIVRKPILDLWPSDLVPPMPFLGYRDQITPMRCPVDVTQTQVPANWSEVAQPLPSVYELSTQAVDNALDEIAELVFNQGFKAIHFDFYSLQSHGLVLPLSDTHVVDVPYATLKENAELANPLNLQIMLTTLDGTTSAGSKFEQGYVGHVTSPDSVIPTCDDLITEPYIIPKSYAATLRPASTPPSSRPPSATRNLSDVGKERVEELRRKTDWGQRGAIWQFNLRYDLDREVFAPAAVKEAQSRGVDFVRHQSEGIPIEYLLQGFCKRGLLGPQPHRFGLRHRRTFSCKNMSTPGTVNASSGCSATSTPPKGSSALSKSGDSPDGSASRPRANSVDGCPSREGTPPNPFTEGESICCLHCKGETHNEFPLGTQPLWTAAKGSDFCFLLKGLHMMRRTTMCQMTAAGVDIPEGLRNFFMDRPAQVVSAGGGGAASALPIVTPGAVVGVNNRSRGRSGGIGAVTDVPAAGAAVVSGRSSPGGGVTPPSQGDRAASPPRACCVSCEALSLADSHLTAHHWNGSHSCISGNWQPIYSWPMELSLGIPAGSTHPGVDASNQVVALPVIKYYGSDQPVGVWNGRIFPTPKFVVSVYRRCASVGVRFPMMLWKATLDFWLTMPLWASPRQGNDWKSIIPLYEGLLISGGLAPLRQPKLDKPKCTKPTEEELQMRRNAIEPLKAILNKQYPYDLVQRHPSVQPNSFKPESWAVFRPDEKMSYYDSVVSSRSDVDVLSQTISQLELAMINDNGFNVHSIRNAKVSNDGSSFMISSRLSHVPVDLIDHDFGHSFGYGGGSHNPFASRLKALNREKPNLGAGHINSGPSFCPFSTDKDRALSNPPMYLPEKLQGFDNCLQYYLGTYLDLRLMFRLGALMDTGRLEDEAHKKKFWEMPLTSGAMTKEILGLETFMNISLRSPFLSSPCRYQIPRTQIERMATEIPIPQVVPTSAVHPNPCHAPPTRYDQPQNFDDKNLSSCHKWPMFTREAMQLQTPLPRNEVRHLLWPDADACPDRGDRDYDPHRYTSLDGEVSISHPSVQAVSGSGISPIGRCRAHDMLVNLARGNVTCNDIYRLNVPFCPSLSCAFCFRTKYGVGQYSDLTSHYNGTTASRGILSVPASQAFIPPPGCPVFRFPSSQAKYIHLPLTPYPLFPHYTASGADGAFIPARWKLIRSILHNVEMRFCNVLNKKATKQRYTDMLLSQFMGGSYTNNTAYKVGPYRGSSMDSSHGANGLFALPPSSYVQFGILSEVVPIRTPPVDTNREGWLWSDHLLSMDQRMELMAYLQGRPRHSEKECNDYFGFGAASHHLIGSLAGNHDVSANEVFHRINTMANIMSLRLAGLGGSLVAPRVLFNVISYKKLVESLKITTGIDGALLHSLADPVLTNLSAIRARMKPERECEKILRFHRSILRSVNQEPLAARFNPDGVSSALEVESLPLSPERQRNQGICLDNTFAESIRGGSSTTLVRELIRLSGKVLEVIALPPEDLAAMEAANEAADDDLVAEEESKPAGDGPPAGGQLVGGLWIPPQGGVGKGIRLHPMAQEFTPSVHVAKLHSSISADGNAVHSPRDGAKSTSITATAESSVPDAKVGSSQLKLGRGVLQVNQSQLKLNHKP
eukprot:GHVH01007858.1.p1 GENE.GHVH01007858.1~~GHVH01007858.1.p1  ORF type:complete len:1819 (+),score=224.96 GHVH01007858.1:205-5661(+)